jgi:hypothetical protein
MVFHVDVALDLIDADDRNGLRGPWTVRNANVRAGHLSVFL